MAHEPVYRLHEHLLTKWALASHNYDIMFFHKGARASLSDNFSQYLDQPGGTKLSLEFELFPSGDGVSTTASSTPVVSPRITTNAGAPTAPVASQTVTSIMEEIQSMYGTEDEVSHVVRPHAAEGLESVRQEAPGDVRPEAASTMDAPVTTSNRKSKSSKNKKAAVIPVDSVRPAATESTHSLVPMAESPSVDSAMIPFNDTIDRVGSNRVEAVYREMLDRERDIFMSILDNQAKWMTQIQSQMMSACLSIQENTIRLLGSRVEGKPSSSLEDTSVSTSDNENFCAKKQRR
jgi:hypothetical protein